MKLFTILNFIVGTLSISIDDMYNEFIVKFNKTYDKHNIDIYQKNIEYIDYINNQNLSYTLEENQFTDFINKSGTKLIIDNNGEYYNFSDKDEIPINYDWRNKNKLTNVKNQLDCGSCWAFSTTGSIEALVAIKTDVLHNISEQQLVDCSSSYGNNGCNGGSMDNGFKYVIDNGLCSEKTYPYTAQQGNCESCDKVVSIDNFKDLTPNDEKSLKRAVYNQPVSVAIQANLKSFQLYSGGIYSDEDCGTQLDHGVLLVGYGYDLLHDMDYWIIKNSWGPNWGENGYIRILRNYQMPQGLCGVAMIPSIPVLN